MGCEDSYVCLGLFFRPTHLGGDNARAIGEGIVPNFYRVMHLLSASAN